MNPAAKVAAEKQAHPERFCAKCLWRIIGRDGLSTPCRNHPVAAPCQHHDLAVLVSYGSAFDDIATSYGYCAPCDDFFVVVDSATSRESTARPMTPAERERLQTEDYRRTRLALRLETVDA